MSLDRIPVYYDPRMLAIPERCFFPSAEIPRHVVEGWLSRQFPIDVQSFQPVSAEALKHAHEAVHVDGGTEDIILRPGERERIRHVTVGEEYRDEHQATDFLAAGQNWVEINTLRAG